MTQLFMKLAEVMKLRSATSTEQHDEEDRLQRTTQTHPRMPTEIHTRNTTRLHWRAVLCRP